jgi:ribosome-binding protein aMBF1 (putative translation factor)
VSPQQPSAEALQKRSESTMTADFEILPHCPNADRNGNYPAVEYGRVSIAREIIRDRVAAGLSQKELAKRASIRVETLCRVEAAQYTASARIIQKIDRAVARAKNGKRKKK